MCVVAVILILVGSVMYGFWEQMTSQRQREEQPNPYSTAGESEYDDDDRTTVGGNHRFSSVTIGNRASAQQPLSEQQQQNYYGSVEA